METSNSGANQAFLQSQFNRRSVGPIETCISDPKALFCLQKQQIRAVTHRD